MNNETDERPRASVSWHTSSTTGKEGWAITVPEGFDEKADEEAFREAQRLRRLALDTSAYTTEDALLLSQAKVILERLLSWYDAVEGGLDGDEPDKLLDEGIGHARTFLKSLNGSGLRGKK